MLKTVYIDTSVICHLTDPPSNNSITRGCQELTQLWWKTRCVPELTYISDVVLEEIKAGDPTLFERRMEVVEKLVYFSPDEDVQIFAELLILGGGLKAKSRKPAEHVASAALHQLHILMTWNCVDIANAQNFEVLRKLMMLKDLELPELVTPFALMENSYEDIQY
jgi:hypothetical protein